MMFAWQRVKKRPKRFLELKVGIEFTACLTPVALAIELQKHLFSWVALTRFVFTMCPASIEGSKVFFRST